MGGRIPEKTLFNNGTGLFYGRFRSGNFPDAGETAINRIVSILRTAIFRDQHAMTPLFEISEIKTAPFMAS